MAQGADLVLHAAGPFQRRTECNVLEACIAARVPYIDICDDADYSQRAKALHQKCAAAAIAPGFALGNAAAFVVATAAIAASAAAPAVFQMSYWFQLFT